LVAAQALEILQRLKAIEQKLDEIDCKDSPEDKQGEI